MAQKLHTPGEQGTLELTLVRHGEALSLEEAGVSVDFDRPLTARGRRQVLWISKRMSLTFDLVFVSPAVRTQETWDGIVNDREKPLNLIESQELYLAGRKTLQKVFEQTLQDNPKLEECSRILLVGHNPGISQLAYFLCGFEGGMGTADLLALKLSRSILKGWTEAIYGEDLWIIDRFVANEAL